MEKLSNLKQDIIRSVTTATVDKPHLTNFVQEVGKATTKDELINTLTTSIMWLSRNIIVEDRKTKESQNRYYFEYREEAIRLLHPLDPRIPKIIKNTDQSIKKLIRILCDEEKNENS